MDHYLIRYGEFFVATLSPFSFAALRREGLRSFF